MKPELSTCTPLTNPQRLSNWRAKLNETSAPTQHSCDVSGGLALLRNEALSPASLASGCHLFPSTVDAVGTERPSDCPSPPRGPGAPCPGPNGAGASFRGYMVEGECFYDVEAAEACAQAEANLHLMEIPVIRLTGHGHEIECICRPELEAVAV